MEEVLDKAEQTIFELSQNSERGQFQSVEPLLHNVMDKLGSAKSEGVAGIPTGYYELDKYLSGFQKSDFIVIAGRPSMGKTALALSLARNIAVEHGPNNISANCISPGLVKTYFAKALWDNPEILKNTTSKAPLRRIGMPDEIAGAAVFLSSKAGAFTTGQNGWGFDKWYFHEGTNGSFKISTYFALVAFAFSKIESNE